MPNAVTRQKLPLLLLVSSLAAPLFGFGTLLLPLAIIGLEFASTGHSATLAQLQTPTEAWAAIGCSVLIGAWFIALWRGLRSGRPWVRSYLLASCGLLFLLWAILAVRASGSLLHLSLGALFLVVGPWWYLFRKRSVVSYFASLSQPSEA